MAGVAITLAGCGELQRKAEVLELERQPQRTTSWCWAASTQMVLTELLGGDAPALCGEGGILDASSPLDFPEACEPICSGCGDPKTQELAYCVSTGWPVLDPFGISYDVTPKDKQKSAAAALSWHELKEQLSPGADGRSAPVIFSWHWTGGGGHVLVANGFVEHPGLGDSGRLVLVQDPWPPCIGDTYLLPYEAWVGSPETGRQHWRDYWNLRVETPPKPPPGGWQRQPPPSPMLPMLPRAEDVDPALGAPIGPPGEASKVARHGLRILRRLADHETTRAELGFLSSADLKLAAFTRTAISHRRVRLDELEAWTPEQDPASLADEEDWVFPITRVGGGAVFTAVVVERRAGAWELAELGGKGWIERLAIGFHATQRMQPPWPVQECWLLAVPSLRRYFVARELDGEGLHLLPIPDLGSPLPTASRPASEVFPELRAAALAADPNAPG